MAKIFDTIRVLVLDDNSEQAEQLINMLRNAGHPVRPKHITELKSLEDALQHHSWDLCLTHWQLRDLSAMDAIHAIKQQEKDIPVLIVQDQIDMTRWIEALNAGAADIVSRKDDEHLVLKAEREISHLKTRRLNKKLEFARRTVEKRCQLLLDSSREAIAYIHDGVIVHANSAFIHLFNYQNAESLEHTSIIDLIANDSRNSFKEDVKKVDHEDNSINSSAQFIKNDGHTFTADLNISPAIYEQEICTQIIVRMQNESQALGRKIQLINTQDLLTGLHTRQYLLQCLEDEINYCASEQKNGALMFFEILNFNDLKTSLGIGAVDLLISDVSDFLKKTITIDIILARFSEDVFAALIKNTEAEPAKMLALNVVNALRSQTFTITMQEVKINCIAGIAAISESAPSSQELLSRAHHACTTAERLNTPVEVYQVGRDNNVPEGLDREFITVIQKALENGQFKLQYQPVISLHSENLEFYEVHLRMRDSEGKDISPDAFFPAAFQGGLMAKIDRWVILHASKILSEHRLRGDRAYLFIRLSVASILDDGLLSWISTCLKTSRLPSDAFVFEIPETDAAAHTKHTKALIQGLKAIRCKIALTKFGTGINSFNTLKIVDPDFVKLDESFTRELTANNSDARSQMQLIIRSVQSQGKLCIIPHVEDANIIQSLWQMGVNFIQGFYLKPPSDKLNYDFNGHFENV